MLNIIKQLQRWTREEKKTLREMIGYGFTAASATGWCWVRIPAELR